MYKIIYYILIFLIFCGHVCCIPDEFQELVTLLHTTCVNQSNVTEETIKMVNTKKEMVDDENLKCYIKCLLSETGSISDDGIIDVEATIALLPESMKELSEPVIRQCGSIPGTNPCESAWLTHKCYIETNPEVYVLI